MKKQSPEKRNYRRQLIYTLLYFLVWGAFVIAIYLWAPAGPTEVPYSQFLEALEAAEVTHASIGEERVVWTVPREAGERVFVSDRLPGIEESELIEQLRAIDAEFTGEPPNAFWPLVLGWVVPILLLVLLWRFFLGRLPGATQALSFGRSRAKIWDKTEGDEVTFDDVAGLDEAGLDEAVAKLREVVDYLMHPEKYTRVGARIPKGVLLVGPPGTGKTLLARATAGEADVPFFSISGADFVEMFVGVGAARVRDLFKQAREHAPCIVFVDEIDTIGRSRAGARSPVSNEEREQTLNQPLVELDGFDSSAGVILMAATNRPDVLDPALLRPGRFDRQIAVDKPDINGREAILRVHTRNVALASDVDLRVVAARTPGFAGAELGNLVNEAALLAVRHGRAQVTMADFDDAVDRVMMGLERKSRALNEREREGVAFHEMGHALAGMLLPHADPVHKVSIVPRGTAALGVTVQRPLEDRFLLTEAELRDRMTVLLAGRAAEEVTYGEVSTEPADDLQRATEMARRMVTEFGMNEGLGPVVLEERANGFLDDSGEFRPRRYGEETADAIDQEVRRLVSSLYERAQTLLRKHREVPERGAKWLLEKEVMEGTELEALLDEMGIEWPVYLATREVVDGLKVTPAV